MKRKMLSLFLCSFMLTCVVSGCDADESTANTSSSSSIVEETEYKTMEPPEGNVIKLRKSKIVTGIN